MPPPLYSAVTIETRVGELGAQIRRDHHGQPLTMIAVLKGALPFAADLMRSLNRPVNLEFVHASSYGDARRPGALTRRFAFDPRQLRDQCVLVVDDIVDTGQTLDRILRDVRSVGARSVRACALLNKPNRRNVDIDVDYVGFTIDDHFVVGYGMDDAGRHRELPYIGVVDGTQP